MSADQPGSKYVRLVSYDGFEFIVRREAANISLPLSKALDPKSEYKEALERRYESDEENLTGDVMETICQFLYYKIKHKDSKSVPDMELPIEQLLQLIVAADFLAGKLKFLDGSSLYVK